MLFYGKQSISEEDITAVSDVLRDALITQGPVSQALESAICQYTGANHAVACSHGSAALHLACLAIGVSEGDCVWTVPNTFVASANCALYCQAEIDFVDIDPDTFNICPQALEHKLHAAERDGRLPKAIVAVHFAGLPCDMAAISELTRRYGVSVIEDGCHALGAQYKEKKIGACEYSDITIFSLHPVKSITAGEGGLLLTNNKHIAERARLFANHGITRNIDNLEMKEEGEWYYEQKVLGFNYRITDFQCALALSQLKRLDEFINKRCMQAREYELAFDKQSLKFQKQSDQSNSSRHLFVVCSQKDDFDKAMVFKQFKARGVVLNCHYIPVHLQPYYRRRFGFQEGDFPRAERYFSQSVSLPIYPDLEPAQQQQVIDAVLTIFD